MKLHQVIRQLFKEIKQDSCSLWAYVVSMIILKLSNACSGEYDILTGDEQDSKQTPYRPPEK